MLRLSYIDKYNSNKIWAESAYSASEFDVATNRYYYSIFQKILFVLDNNGVKVDGVDGEGSHDHTARLFVEKCLIGKKFTQKTQFNSSFQGLKKYRKKADYKDDRIDQSEVLQARLFYKQLDSIILS